MTRATTPVALGAGRVCCAALVDAASGVAALGAATASWTPFECGAAPLARRASAATSLAFSAVATAPAGALVAATALASAAGPLAALTALASAAGPLAALTALASAAGPFAALTVLAGAAAVAPTVLAGAAAVALLTTARTITLGASRVPNAAVVAAARDSPDSVRRARAGLGTVGDVGWGALGGFEPLRAPLLPTFAPGRAVVAVRELP